MTAFVSEHGAIDPLLPAVINELSPNKEGVAVPCSKDDGFSRADKLASFSSVPVDVGAVVSLIKRETGRIAVFRQIPERV